MRVFPNEAFDAQTLIYLLCGTGEPLCVSYAKSQFDLCIGLNSGLMVAFSQMN